MKSRSKMLLVAIVVIAGFAALLSYVNARPTFKQYPQPHPLCAVDAEVTMSNGAVVGSSGTMSMEITGESSPDEIVPSQTLRATSFNSVGDHPEFGHVVWMLDDSREAEPTVISGTADGELYPASCDIVFYVKATASNFGDDVTFYSTTPVRMRSTDLMSFNPHYNEAYQLVEPVDFTTDLASGEVSFTVTDLTSILN